MKWKDKLVDYIIDQLSVDSEWQEIAHKIYSDSSIGIHLAVFNELFLSLVFSGEKKVESRFSINRISPFQRIECGDLVILKESGGPIAGVFVAGQVAFFKQTEEPLVSKIEADFGDLICTAHDENFWEKREKANYASLIEIQKVTRLPDFKIEKRDRRGWVILR